MTTSDGWPLPPDPRPAPAPPANLTADRMVFTVGSKPDDSNGNGFPDSIKAAVSLFSLAHPMALQQDGVFIFTLYAQGQAGAPNAKPLGVWRVESSSLQATLARTLAGPSYLFQLSLLDVGGDVLPLERADLVCQFQPAAPGAPIVTSDGVRSIQIGRRLSSAGFR